MLKIRLMRKGKKGQAFFRVVVQEARSKNQGKYLDDLGFWNPHQNKFNVKEERVRHWLSNGAKPSDTVHNFLVDKGLVEGPKVKKVRPKPRPEAVGVPTGASEKKEEDGKLKETVPAEKAEKPEAKEEASEQEEQTVPEQKPEQPQEQA